MQVHVECNRTVDIVIIEEVRLLVDADAGSQINHRIRMLDFDFMDIFMEDRRRIDKLVAVLYILIELEIEHFRDIELCIELLIHLDGSHQGLIADQPKSVLFFRRLYKDDLILTSTRRNAEKVSQNLIPSHRLKYTGAPVGFREIKDNADRAFHAFTAVKGRKDTNICAGCYMLFAVRFLDAGIYMVLVIEVAGSCFQFIQNLYHRPRSGSETQDILRVLGIQIVYHLLAGHSRYLTVLVHTVDILAPDVSEPLCKVMRQAETLREIDLRVLA